MEANKPKGAGGQRINCFACVSFYITYEPGHPYGCRAMSFKSVELPSLSVYKNSGMECQAFKKKAR